MLGTVILSYCYCMTQLSEKEHQAQMDDMKSFDEQMPCVGIFWYDLEEKSFFGVCKKEITPKMVEEARSKGIRVINYPEYGHKAAIEREESDARINYPEREQARPKVKTDEQIAMEGLETMEQWMRELGLAMNITDCGAKPELIEGMADACPICQGGYYILNRDEVVQVLKESL